MYHPYVLTEELDDPLRRAAEAGQNSRSQPRSTRFSLVRLLILILPPIAHREWVGFTAGFQTVQASQLDPRVASR